MRFDIVTLFPEIIQASLEASILKRAISQGKISVHFWNIRDYAQDTHNTVDDTPYGGGAGMLLKVDVVDRTLQTITESLAEFQTSRRRIILLTPQGKRLRQPIAQFMADSYDQITLICGHYEGFDERIRLLVDAELSIGDFVLTGGELPAALIIDTVARLLPKVIRGESSEDESFCITDGDKKLLEYPHYTRPATYKEQSVPPVLVSGNHAEIAKWRLEQARLKTRLREKDTDETI